jgi:acylphosphatase
MKRISAIVSGRVQGVGFRYFVLRVAQKLKLDGWVRNLGSGDVEVVAQGEPAVLEELLRRLRTGPSGAYVQNVAVEWGEVVPEPAGFDVRPTEYF